MSKSVGKTKNERNLNRGEEIMHTPLLWLLLLVLVVIVAERVSPEALRCCLPFRSSP
jgi:hypothetical protein